MTAVIIFFAAHFALLVGACKAVDGAVDQNIRGCAAGLALPERTVRIARDRGDVSLLPRMSRDVQEKAFDPFFTTTFSTGPRRQYDGPSRQ